MICQYFLALRGSSLYFVNVVLIHKNFKFSWSPVYLLSLLLLMPLVSYLRCYWQIQCHEAFTLFSSKSFIVLGHTFRSLILFELIFSYSIKNSISFFHRFFQHHLLKRLVKRLSKFHMNFRMSFCFCKIHHWDFDKDFIESIDHFG